MVSDASMPPSPAAHLYFTVSVSALVVIIDLLVSLPGAFTWTR